MATVDIACCTAKPILTALPTVHLLAYNWAGSGSSPYPSSLSERAVSDLVVDHYALSSTELLAYLKPSTHVARVTHAIYLGSPNSPPFSPEVTTMQLDLAATIEAGQPASIVDSLAPMLLGATSMAKRLFAVAGLRAITLAQSAEEYAAAIRVFSKDMGEGCKPVDWAAIRERVKVLAVEGEEDVFLGEVDIAGSLDRAAVKTIARAGHTIRLEVLEETVKTIVEFLQS